MGVVTCGCRCNQEVNVNDEEISKETGNSKNTNNKNISKYKGNIVYSNLNNNKSDYDKNLKKIQDNDLFIIKEQQNGEIGIDLDEPLIEFFNKDPYVIDSKKNNELNSNYNSNNNKGENINSNNNTNKTINSNSNSIYTLNNNTNLNNNSNDNNYLPNKKNNNSNELNKDGGINNIKINQNTLKIFNISYNKSAKNLLNGNNDLNLKPKHNRSNSNSLNINENSTNLNHSLVINGIHKLNDIFINQKKNTNNDSINVIWKTLDITSFISTKKLNSTKIDEIMFNGNIYKMILSNIFKNCSMNIQKFCILTRKKFCIFQNRENFLLSKSSQRELDLSQIESCGRLDFSLLNIHYLNKYFFMYIDIKDIYENDNSNDDAVYKVVQKEQNGKFYVLFSKNEKEVNQWVCVINFFLNINNKL